MSKHETNSQCRLGMSGGHLGGAVRALWFGGAGAAVAVALFCSHGCRSGSDAKEQASEDKAGVGKKLSKTLAAIVATCADAKGTVEVGRAKTTVWQRVAVGTSFREGDRVRTGPRSYARIRFQVGGSIELSESTSIVVALAALKGGKKKGVVIAVKTGSVRGVIDGNADSASADSTPSGRLLVKTQSGAITALVAGTKKRVEFRLTARGDGGTEVAVTKGVLKLEKAPGKVAMTVKSGRAVDLRRGNVSAPVTLIGFPASISPGIDARFHYVDGLKIKLTWRPVKGASGYSVQVARDMTFHSIVATGHVTGVAKQLSYEFTPGRRGVYAWRVTAQDRHARSGESGFARRIYCEKEAPKELLVAPKTGAKFALTANSVWIRFTWQSAGSTDTYRFVIRRGNTPKSKTVVDRILSSQSVVIKSLGQGRYSWGVYATKPERPLFVKMRRFTIRKRRAPRVNTKDLWD